MRILFFAQAKDAAGASELEVKICGSPDLDAMWRELILARPALATFRASSRLARNGEYADEKTVFDNEDEVALIPPVSGG
jgi:molybdopterin converting factor subunit 1